MLYAFDINGQPIRPSEHRQEATDPYSGATVYGIVGAGLNYWRHDGDLYDSWALPNATWNLEWKLLFPSNIVEISVQGHTERHVADVRANNGAVIKFQSRMLDSKQLRERELFFDKMIWVFKTDKWDMNINTEETVSSYINTEGKSRQLPISDKFKWCKFRASYPKIAFKACKMPVFLDFGDENLYWFNWQLFSNVNNDFNPSNGVLKFFPNEQFIAIYQ
jgi:hypothetical protein